MLKKVYDIYLNFEVLKLTYIYIYILNTNSTVGPTCVRCGFGGDSLLLNRSV